MRYSRGRISKKSPNFLKNQFLHRIILDNEEYYKMCKTNAYGHFISFDKEVYKWCCKTYGKFCIDWGMSVRGEQAIFYFKTKDDALAFKLMWTS